MNEELFQELIESVQEGGEILRGEAAPSREVVVETPDVKGIREQLRLSQSEFAAMLGISIDTLQNWEQGRRRPAGPARVLLLVAKHHPESLLAVVRPLRRAS